ncbi:hypothetical protein KKY53_25300 [Pseudomonas aeruginosa]|uniref:hypothetical protein n=1 Tax=Pseudomonas aeruginosa TaxID=287 RepID=UPI0011C47801|nr:hypothetical protein [Pseudomonas aeruginosa]MDG3713321.1 hypothetical protein [Pseudomonas aeruginosa]WCV77958.1 hypothetical protein KKY53_25300 [Pseudomonas aeruginosa]HBO0862417.1 hypothetical protein [Pseudomonas aeruginosa]HBO5216414.1 hypothetical protein [Pseudomonas aeruginosa]HCE6880411.1 hypothetical protein [Pseudomonas aeruginosa]
MIQLLQIRNVLHFAPEHPMPGKQRTGEKLPVGLRNAVGGLKNAIPGKYLQDNTSSHQSGTKICCDDLSLDLLDGSLTRKIECQMGNVGTTGHDVRPHWHG